MNNKTFYLIFSEAVASENRDAFISDWALSSVFPVDSDPTENAEIIGSIWDVANMSVKDLCKKTKLSQVAISDRFCVPYRTVQEWYGGRRTCPQYFKLAMAELLGLINITRE